MTRGPMLALAVMAAALAGLFALPDEAHAWLLVVLFLGPLVSLAMDAR